MRTEYHLDLRDSGRFGEIWIPPFPNDSGSALGAACAEMMRRSERWYLDWDVYCGPALQPEPMPTGWTSRAAELDLVAKLLHAGEPVVFLHGRAELGPRALGHRSILAAPVDIRMRDLLNEIKHRESYRPVAPVCLAERAAEVFDPGGHDPFMLFQNGVRSAWRNRVPAVAHADDTARLQTVSPEQEPVLYDLLHRYEQLSGIPRVAVRTARCSCSCTAWTTTIIPSSQTRCSRRCTRSARAPRTLPSPKGDKSY